MLRPVRYILTTLFLVLICTLNAQLTTIPGQFFEQKLIDLNLDTGTVNGFVPTSFIDTVTILQINNAGITDLTGIEDFTALTFLSCQNNSLSNFNISQNIALTRLYCQNNLLTSLDVSHNIALTYLLCSYNLLSNLNLSLNIALTDLICEGNSLVNLNVSNNIALIQLHCRNNLITSMDVSQNPNLTNFICEHNSLTCLNLRNGNNVNINPFDISDNPNLTCVEVDNSVNATAQWGIFLISNPSSYFSEDCYNACTVGVNETNLSKFTIYPNPTNGLINIEFEKTEIDISLALSNALGQSVLNKQYSSTNSISLDVTNIPNGVYFLKLELNGNVIAKKFVKK